MADMVNRGESVADIGTDHAYVPMILMRDGISPRVIMSDISEGSLAKAKETFSICELSVPDSDFRIGDGLDTISPGEVDVIIIGGLGGHTIADILDSDIDKSKSFKRFILQPRKHSGALRYYLYTRGFDITEEAISKEGKFECEIIAAVPTSDELRQELYPADDIRWKYPAEMVNSNPELAIERIKWKINSIDEQIENLKTSNTDKSELITVLEKDKEYLIDIVNNAYNSHNNH